MKIKIFWSDKTEEIVEDPDINALIQDPRLIVKTERVKDENPISRVGISAQ